MYMKIQHNKPLSTAVHTESIKQSVIYNTEYTPSIVVLGLYNNTIY